MPKKSNQQQYILLDMSLLLGVYNFGIKYTTLPINQRIHVVIFGTKKVTSEFNLR